MLESLSVTGTLRGRLRPPGDKSISHRALIFSALAEGQSTIHGLLVGADVQATQSALTQLGAEFRAAGDSLLVEGLGAQGLREPATELDMGNSGTAMRLLAGVLAAQPFNSRLVGDESLSSRPMRRIIQPLRQMGADISGTTADTAPLTIAGRNLHGIDYESPVASAQIKSCLLLAGLYAQGTTRVREPGLSRDHTERMLPLFGVDMPGPARVAGGSQLQCAEVDVPADISSAAFLVAAALLTRDSDIDLQGVGLNPTRDGFLRALQAMGAEIDVSGHEGRGFEPVGNLHVRYSGRLKAIDLPPEWIPAMVDEVPVMMVLAAMADGVTRIRGAAELRVKESDRLAVMGAGLRKMGVSVTEYEDGVDIVGTERLSNAVLESAGDHRCAMSFAILGLCADHGVQVRDPENIVTSYPGFVDDMNLLGARMRLAKQL